MKKMFYSVVAFFASVPAFAEMGSETVSSSGTVALAAGLCLGAAALGGALGQGKVGSSAMDGIARNPQAKDNMFVPMIIGLVFIETLVIFSFVIALQILG